MYINIERELRYRMTPISNRHVFTCKMVIKDDNLNIKHNKYFIYSPAKTKTTAGIDKIQYRWVDGNRARKQFKKSQLTDDSFFELMKSYLS